jgi:hypothetical protein
MATKAQKFKTLQERTANPPKTKKPPLPRRDEIVDTAEPGVSASDRKVGAGGTATRNVSKRAANKGGAALEDSQTGQPSRKSTRKSTGRQKRTSNLQLRAIRKVSSAKTRATKANSRAKKK